MRILALLLAACSLAAFAHDVTRPAEGVALDPRLGAQVRPALPFVDDRGRGTTLAAALRGRPGVVVLGYATCQDLCPVTLAGAARALREGGLAPGRDYAALFVSIDPRDDAAALASAKVRDLPADAQPAWTFLSNAASTRELARDIGYRFRHDEDPDAIAHAAGFVVLTPEARVSRYFTGVRFDPSDVRLALAEAANGQVGSVIDRLVLLCYHFDPVTGKYTMQVLSLLRGVGFFFLVGLAAVYAWLRFHGREAA